MNVVFFVHTWNKTGTGKINRTKYLYNEVKTRSKIKIGDLVQMRTKALSMRKYARFPAVDYGIVTNVTPSQYREGTDLVQVLWQIHGKSIKIYSDRLKKVRLKKNVK